MSEKEDSAWVFDSLVGFLQGPIWSAPLMTFIEEKSLIFEADIEDNIEYQKLYQEYKNLVDLLLGCFMEDMGITPELFERACAINKSIKIPVQFQQNLFEQIWAANEYTIFKRMMIQKNLELQLQALNMIEQKYGLTPASYIYDDETRSDDLAMDEIIQKRILDESGERASEIGEGSLIEERERLSSEYRNEKALLDEVLKSPSPSAAGKELERELREGDSKTSTGIGKSSPRTMPETSRKSVARVLSESISKKTRDETNPEDIKKRQEYLKSRRDKLVALRKEVRSQRLVKNEERPSTALSVAEDTMSGKGTSKTAPDELEPAIMQIRKTLAARLKAEVVNK